MPLNGTFFCNQIHVISGFGLFACRILFHLILNYISTFGLKQPYSETIINSQKFVPFHITLIIISTTIQHSYKCRKTFHLNYNSTIFRTIIKPSLVQKSVPLNKFHNKSFNIAKCSCRNLFHFSRKTVHLCRKMFHFSR